MSGFECACPADLTSESPVNVSSVAPAWKSRWAAAVTVVVLAVTGLVAASAPAQAQSCLAGTGSDFDGDGAADVAIADPDAVDVSATGNSYRRSGLVHIAYGDGDRQTIGQSDTSVVGPETGDRFGFDLASTDWNGDGCADLFIASPFEAWGGAAQSGVVVLVYGSPTGLDAAGAVVFRQAALGIGAEETGDRFGYAIAAGISTAGLPFLIAGTPGENDDSGAAAYVTPSDATGVSQDSPGVAGVAEAGDLFGYAVAASGSAFVVGGPGESIGVQGYAGTVAMFAHNDASASPVMVGGADQDVEGIAGVAEAGDLMGAAVAMADYQPTDGSGVATLVAVGAPGEDGDDGWVLDFDADGGLMQRRTFSQGTAIEEGGKEDGDTWGGVLGMVNRTPDQAVSWEDLLIVGGAPGEDKEDTGLADRGIVQIVSGIGGVADHDLDADQALEAAGLDWASGQRIGTSFLARPDALLIADPWSASPAVYALPWDHLLADATGAAVVYTPADFGLDPAQTASFGAALA